MRKIFGIGLAGFLALANPANADYFKLSANDTSGITGSYMHFGHEDPPSFHIWSYNPPGNWIRISTGLNYDQELKGIEDNSSFNGILEARNSVNPGNFITNGTRLKFENLDGWDPHIPDYSFSITAGSFHESGSVNDVITHNGGYTDTFTYDSSVGATLTLTPTPEPSTLVLLGAGALIIGTFGIIQAARRKGMNRLEYEVVRK